MVAANISIHEAQAEVLKAIGHPVRLQIVKGLAEGEMTVTDIVKLVGAEQSNVSRHLSLLKQAGILASRKSGLKVFYRLNGHEFHNNLKGLLDCISGSLGGDGHDRSAQSESTRREASPPAGG